MEKIRNIEALTAFKWIYKVHFPGKVFEVNNNVSMADKDKGTATWVFTLKDLVRRPQNMVVVYAVPAAVDFKALGIAGIVFLGFFVMLYKVLMKRDE